MTTEFQKKGKIIGIFAVSLYFLLFILGFNLQAYLLALFTCVIAFGIYSLLTVLKMTTSFNDCVEAKEELSKEILEAKAFYEPLHDLNIE